MPRLQPLSRKRRLKAKTTPYQERDMVIRPFTQDVGLLGYEAPVAVDVVEGQVGADVEIRSGD